MSITEPVVTQSAEELRERIASALAEHDGLTYLFEGDCVASDGGRDVYRSRADAVIDELRLAREEEWVGPRSTSWTQFEPHQVERWATPWRDMR